MLETVGATADKEVRLRPMDRDTGPEEVAEGLVDILVMVVMAEMATKTDPMYTDLAEPAGALGFSVLVPLEMAVP